MKSFVLALVYLLVFCQGVLALTLEEKIGQLIIVGFNGTELSAEALSPLKEQIGRGEIGGLLFLGRNIVNAEQTKKLISAINSLSPPYPLLFAVDQEGGKVARLSVDKGFSLFPGAAEVAKTKNSAEAFALYLKMAEELKSLGFNYNLAPVVDLNIDPDSPAIGRLGRSFSEDPEIVVTYASAFIGAHRQAGVLTSLKHFPGHGSAAQDSHLGLTETTTTWQEKELLPYAQLIEDRLVDSVMSAHLYNKRLDPDLPASLSVKTLNGRLRRDLGYEGVIISDDLQMKAIGDHYSLEETVIRALNAGNDLLLFANYQSLDPELPAKIRQIILRALQDGRIARSTIERAFQRVLALKLSGRQISAQLGNSIYRLETALSPAERARGLSGRFALAKKGGMIFVFPRADRHYFCMKGMNFPLDFVWIRGEQIVGLSENVPLSSAPKIFSTREEVDKVVELNAGEIQASGLKVGDKIRLTIN